MISKMDHNSCWVVVSGHPYIFKERGSRKCLVECLRVSNMHAHSCPTNTYLKYIFFLFFSKYCLLCIWFHFNPTPLFLLITSFGSGTHAHTHTTHSTPKAISKSGLRLGRKLYHPTCPAGTLVRYPHHLIVWQPIRYQHHPIISRWDMTRYLNHPTGSRRVPIRELT